MAVANKLRAAYSAPRKTIRRAEKARYLLTPVTKSLLLLLVWHDCIF